MERSDSNHNRPQTLPQIRSAMTQAGIDLLALTSPKYILMASGYWPVTGASVFLISHEKSVLLAPADEAIFADTQFSGTKIYFATASLENLDSLGRIIKPYLETAIHHLGVIPKQIGYEMAALNEPMSYVSLYFPRSEMFQLFQELLPDTRIQSFDLQLQQLTATLDSFGLCQLKHAVTLAANAFENLPQLYEPGVQENELAPKLSAYLASGCTQHDRSGGQFFCMSGPNSAHAYAAFQQTTNRKIQNSDRLLVHCNSYYNGFWTDITRSYQTGKMDQRTARLLGSIFKARDSALAKIKPGIPAREVDGAARRVLEAVGVGKEFKHGLGHAVGYSAINHLAIPRIHPASTDILEAGMVFNIEPAVYFEGEFGLRHCDMVEVVPTGVKLLTPFVSSVAECELNPGA